MSEKLQEGKIIRISGPVIEADGMRGAKMYDVVRVGEENLIGEIIRLNNPELELFYEVYGSDQIEPRYILTKRMVARIIEFRKRTHKLVFLSFVQGKMFVAISQRKDIFLYRPLKNVVDFAPVKEYFEQLSFVIGIIDDIIQGEVSEERVNWQG